MSVLHFKIYKSVHPLSLEVVGTRTFPNLKEDRNQRIQTAWDKYMEGNGGSTISNALGNINVNVSVLKDNVETSSFYLF